MKRLAIIFLLGLAVFFQACEGPPGPPGIPGPQGPQGQAGLVLLGEVFEADIAFTAQNGYLVDFDFNPAIEPSDVVLVYIRWETFNNTPVWRLLPQTVFFEEGVLIYNYDFTLEDFTVFLETTFDPEILDDSWTRNQRIRVVVLPADFAASARIDYSDYEGILELVGATEDDFVKIEPRNK
jgi:hypothetical protein